MLSKKAEKLWFTTDLLELADGNPGQPRGSMVDEF